jgi:hypothetical protein
MGSQKVLSEFGRRFQLYASMVARLVTLKPILHSREQPNVTRSEIRRVRWLGDVFICEELRPNKLCVACALSWCRNHCPCQLLIVAALPPNYISQPLQDLHVEMTSNTLSRRYEFMVHQTVDVKEFRKRFYCPSYNRIVGDFDFVHRPVF